MPEFKRNMDYVDVASRLEEMRKRFPDLTMSQVKMEFVEVAGKSWVVYTAAAYRTPDDIQPGIGTAWEPIPGPTSFTKDSEVQNAETAAWGRALIAIGASTKNGIASHEEVTNRQGPSEGRESTSRPQSENSAVDPETGEVDPRVDAIMQAAVIGGNTFVSDLANKYNQYGKLSENQLTKGFEAASKILGGERQVRQRVIPNAPPFEYADEDERF